MRFRFIPSLATCSLALFFLVTGCGVTLFDPPDFDNPADPANVSQEFFLVGTILDEPFDLRTSSPRVSYDPEWGTDENDGYLHILAGDTGIEFRSINRLAGPGVYDIGAGEIVMGIWCEPLFVPEFGYNNRGISEGTVIITRMDGFFIEGEFVFLSDDAEVAGTFSITDPTR